jgi:hypothetical protein
MQRLKNKLIKKQNAPTRQPTVGVRHQAAKAQQRGQEINIPQTQGNKNTYAQVTARGKHTRDQDKKQDEKLAKP